LGYRRQKPGILDPVTQPSAAGTLPDQPVITIGAERRWVPLDLREVWVHRELLAFLTWRDVTVRYKQTVLGALWAVLQPLLTTVIFVAFFGRLPGLSGLPGGVPYPLFAYAGLLLWTFFANAVVTSGNSLVNNAHVISKVYFPRVLIPAAAVTAAVVDLLVASVLLAFLCIHYDVALTPNLLFLPMVVVLMVLLAFSIGLWMAALNVRYRDVRHALPFVVQLLLFVSAVIYPSTTLSGRVRTLLRLNPIATFIEAFRACLFNTPLDWPALGIATVTTLLLGILAAYSFQRLESTFGDVV
jgi:lipopolysaccharide transport system permease protein